MSTTEVVTPQEKKQLAAAGERTEASIFYSPYTDIYESSDAVVVTMEVPGVDRSSVDVRLEKNILEVTGNIDPKRYESLEPIYSEYNVGNFSRRFTVSTEIDSDKISAVMADGVLTVTLPKAGLSVARRIAVS